MMLMDIIKSKDNKLLKHSKKLNIRKYRQENDEFMIEGLRFVEEAVISCTNIKYCLYSEDLDGDRLEALVSTMSDKGIDVYRVKEGLINEICDTKSPQGIVAVVEKKDYKLEEIITGSSFFVMVDRIQDPGNLGTIIRTAHAAGGHGIIYNDGTVDPYSPKVLRSTMGSIFHLPALYYSNLLEPINILKEKGFTIYASDLEGSSPYFKENYKGNFAVIIGNEANGIDNSILASADRRIMIPMPGSAESLNAAVALSIFFGTAIISVISYFIAKEQEAKPRKIIFQHLLITALVIIGSYFLREASTVLIAKFG
jgi:TrmH family RNA methyltransferase